MDKTSKLLGISLSRVKDAHQRVDFGNVSKLWLLYKSKSIKNTWIYASYAIKKWANALKTPNPAWIAVGFHF